MNHTYYIEFIPWMGAYRIYEDGGRGRVGWTVAYADSLSEAAHRAQAEGDTLIYVAPDNRHHRLV